MLFSGFFVQPKETTQHVPGPVWATFGLLIPKHYVPPLFILAARPNCAKFPSFKCAHSLILFGLILRDIPNSITLQILASACYWPRSDCLYSLVPASANGPSLLTPALFFPFLDRGRCPWHFKYPPLLATDPACTLLYPPVQTVPPYSTPPPPPLFVFSFPGQRNRRRCPWQACATSASSECAR